MMSVENSPSSDAVLRLGEYWMRAEIMHRLLHSLRVYYDSDMGRIFDNSAVEFDAYLLHWVSALFVVIEGFNKLKLKDENVTRLYNSHIQEMKALRNETYHFTLIKGAAVTNVFRQINWIEELHDAIRVFLRNSVLDMVEAGEVDIDELLLAWSQPTKIVRRKRKRSKSKI